MATGSFAGLLFASKSLLLRLLGIGVRPDPAEIDEAGCRRVLLVFAAEQRTARSTVTD
jgi:hypothetical protein